MKTPPKLKWHRLLGFATILLALYSCSKDAPEPKGAIQGLVTIANSQVPISGLVVNLSGPRTESKTTNAQGRFSFTELPVGNYTLSPDVSGSYLNRTPIAVSVRGNSTTDANFSLTPKGSIKGTVTEAGKTQGILGATVTLSGGPVKKNESKGTDNSGEYLFDNLPDGMYEVKVAHPDYATSTKRGIVIQDGDTETADFKLSKESPVLQVNPTNLNFGIDTDQLSIEIKNEGNSDLVWEIIFDRDELSVSESSGTLPSGDLIPVTFTLDREIPEPQDYSYTVLINSNGGNTELLISFTIVQDTPPPTASFTAEPLDCPSPCKIRITNLSSGEIDSYEWDFGHGVVSTDPNPDSITYSIPGIYTISLEVTGPGGTDQTEQPLEIKQPLPEAAFILNSESICTVPCLTSVIDNSQNSNSWEWDFGDGSSKKIGRNQNHIYQTPGHYTITLTVKNSDGVQDTATKVVEVRAVTFAETFLQFGPGKQVLEGNNGEFWILSSTSFTTADNINDVNVLQLTRDDQGGNNIQIKQTYDSSKTDNPADLLKLANGNWVVSGSTLGQDGKFDIFAQLLDENGEELSPLRLYSSNTLSLEAVQLEPVPGAASFIILGSASAGTESNLYLREVRNNLMGTNSELIVESGNFDTGRGIAVEQDGTILVTGYTSTGSNTAPAILYTKGNTSNFPIGNFPTQLTGYDYSYGYTIQYYTNNQYIVGGLTYSSGSGEPYISFIDEVGNTILNHPILNGIRVSFSSSGEDYINDIEVLDDGSLVLAGSKNRMPYFAKISAQGETLWEKDFSSSSIAFFTRVSQTSDGGFIFTGSREESLFIVKVDALGMIY